MFAPHVTLLTGMPVESDVEETLEALRRGVQAWRASLTPAERGDSVQVRPYDSHIVRQLTRATPAQHPTIDQPHVRLPRIQSLLLPLLPIPLHNDPPL